MDDGPTPKVALRAACSRDVGTGHLRRCLTLARKLHENQISVTILADDDPVSRQLTRGVDDVPVRLVPPDSQLGVIPVGTQVVVLDLPSSPTDESERRELRRQIAELDRNGSTVVSLGHAVTDSPHLRAVIDLYPSAQIHAVNYLEGPEYLLLRPAFHTEVGPSPGDHEQVLVAMGGTDPFGATEVALGALAASGHFGPIRVVLGAGSQTRRVDVTAVAGQLGLDVVVDVELDAEALARLMASCRAGLVAFGTTAYELMALGVPVFAFTHYEWQRSSADFFEALGAVRHLGCAQQGIDPGPVGETLAAALSDTEELGKMAYRGAAVVDGRGAQRVSDLVAGYAAESTDGRRLDNLYVLAHPGDEVLGCGATILKQVRAGKSVGVAILGEGSASRQQGIEPPELVLDWQTRMKSALQEATEQLGIAALYYFRYEDNRFDAHDLLDLIKTVEVLVERHQPQVLYTHHPGDLNIDHRRTFEAVVTAARPLTTSSIRTILSVEVPSSSDWGATLGQTVFQPNWFEDVADVLEEKLALASVYASEIHEDPHPRSLEGLRARAAHWGRLCGLTAAEAFVVHRHLPPGRPS